MDVTLKERYEASMVLSGVGDAIGYCNGKWEFCRSGAKIHEELHQLGGLEQITVNRMSLFIYDSTPGYCSAYDHNPCSGVTRGAGGADCPG